MRRLSFKVLLSVFLLLIGAGLFFHTAEAGREMRSFEAIPSPAYAQELPSAVEEDFQVIAEIKDVPRATIEKAVTQVFESWNTTQMANTLAKNFPNRSRVLDGVRSGAPRGVALEVQQVKHARVLEQFIRKHPSGDGSVQIMSRLSVSVRAKAVYDSPLSGQFTKLEGTSDYIIRITQKVQ